MLAMRERILEIVPDAQEVLSYGMPAFKVDGVIVAGMLANRHHKPLSRTMLKKLITARLATARRG